MRENFLLTVPVRRKPADEKDSALFAKSMASGNRSQACYLQSTKLSLPVNLIYFYVDVYHPVLEQCLSYILSDSMKLFNKKSNKDENNFDSFPPIGGLMVSKMVVDGHIKPRFMYREKRTRPEDSGWRIFAGLETEDYTNNPDNIGIYNASTILKIDPSLKDILLKGIGSVYERADDHSKWYKVTDFDLEDDYMTTHRLTENWILEISNLFERTIEEDGTLYYTTGDKSIRLIIWNEDHSKEELYNRYKQDIEKRKPEKFEFSDDEILRIGYSNEEKDEQKTYSIIFGFSIIDKQVVQTAFYFDEKEEVEWAINTWKNIKLKNRA